MNALHLAAVGGHLEIVKYLMPKFGASRFDLDNLAQNCLHKAVKEGHLKVVRYLIEEGGFDPSLRDRVSCEYIYIYILLNMSPLIMSHCSMCRKIWTAIFWPVTVVSWQSSKSW